MRNFSSFKFYEASQSIPHCMFHRYFYSSKTRCKPFLIGSPKSLLTLPKKLFLSIWENWSNMSLNLQYMEDEETHFSFICAWYSVTTFTICSSKPPSLRIVTSSYMLLYEKYLCWRLKGHTKLWYLSYDQKDLGVSIKFRIILFAVI